MIAQLKIEGMSCGHCVAAVRNALESVDGVTKATVDLSAGTAEIEHGPQATAEALTQAVEEEGYRARVA